MPDMISDTISGKVDWQQREIGKPLGRCAPGDVLVVAEIRAWPNPRCRCWKS
jgi:hypothetical protein